MYAGLGDTVHTQETQCRLWDTDESGNLFCADNLMTGPLPTPAQIAAGMPKSPTTLSNLSGWIAANKTTVYLAAGGLLLMSMFGRRR